MDEKYISEEISSHHNSAEVIDHTCDDNGNNILNTEEEGAITSTHYINETNYISMKDDDNSIHTFKSL